MDYLVGQLVAQDRRDFRTAPPLELDHVGGRIIDQPASEFVPFGVEQAYAIAAGEVTGHLAHARGEQTASLVAQRVGGAPVQRQRPRRLERECDPMLAAAQTRSRWYDQRAALALGIDRVAYRAGFMPRGDNHGDSGARGVARRGQLGRSEERR